MSGLKNLFGGAVLVLEDNVVVAIDAATTLEEMTGRPSIRTTEPGDAIDIIARHEIGFALLDVQLGKKTSADVAHVLFERQTPFILVSGYDEHESLTGFPPSVRLKKPFTDEKLSDAIRSVFNASES